MGYVLISFLSWLILRFLVLRRLPCGRPARTILSCLFFLPILYYAYLQASCFIVLPEPSFGTAILMGAWCGTVLIAAPPASAGVLCLMRFGRKKPMRRVGAGACLIFSLFFSSVLVLCGLREGLSVPSVQEVSVNLPAGRDALDGIRMAVISDLHLGCATPPGWLEETLRRIKEARADIILLDGDLSDGRPEDRRSDLARLGTLEAPLGVWAVPGNHEYYVDYAGIMAALPDSVHVLANSHAKLRTSRGTFVLAGVTDRKARARGLPGPDIEKALSGLSGDGAIGPVLLMSHRPAGWSRNAARGVVLQICGHTHGGQFIWNRLFLRLIGRRYLHGLFERNSSLLWVGSGASQWFGFPLRVGVPPEIAVLNLHAGS